MFDLIELCEFVKICDVLFEGLPVIVLLILIKK